jgi:ceramide glucosyltransferase
MAVVADVVAFLAVLGVVQCLVGWFAVARFASPRSSRPAAYPPITILKPLYGTEPLLEAALESCFRQAYPTFQVVFGLHDSDDPALAVVERLKLKFPQVDVAIVIDATLHGPNRKVSNLINMLPSARHDLLVISDSDLHVPANYLERLVVALEEPGTGLVTAAYIGLPPEELGWRARLGATQISHNFLPGVILSRALGRQDCLGSTAMIHRDVLDRTGGLHALAYLLAEDNVLGQRVLELGLSVALADTVVAATVPEPTIRAVWDHELRWTRTIRVSAPVGLAASGLQYPLFWAAAAGVLSGGEIWSISLFAISWLARAAAMIGVDGSLSSQTGVRSRLSTALLLPLRDALSILEIAASYCVDDVVWRGHKFDANSSAVLPLAAQTISPSASVSVSGS